MEGFLGEVTFVLGFSDKIYAWKRENGDINEFQIERSIHSVFNKEFLSTIQAPGETRMNQRDKALFLRYLYSGKEEVDNKLEKINV